MFDPFKKLKLAGAFLGVPDDAAAAAPETLDIAELFGHLNVKDLRGMSLQADKVLEQPGVRALFESRYMPEPEPLDRLSDLGDGTLGFEYVRYLRHNKLAQPTVPRRLDLNDPAVYLAQRVRMTHPLLHVITEYDASSLGELALQAYYIGQTSNLISGVIISSALLQIVRDTPELLGAALEITSEGFQRGKAARSFLGIAWEELWSAQVPQLRELIDIPARTSALAHIRYEPPPRPAAEPRASRSGAFSVSAFSGSDDGLAALGRQSGGSNTPSSSQSNSPPPRPRNFTGFGGAPLKPEPPRSEPPRGEPPRREPSAPEPRPQSSSSSLLASFMALAEQAARPEPEPVRAEPPRRPEPPPPRRSEPSPPPKVEPRPAARPAAPPATPALPAKPPAPPAAPEPAYKIEELEKNITPALSPDDPDYF